MKRRHVLLMAAMLTVAAGCNAPAPRFDPFLGRTTVAPPSTGHFVSPVPGAADPYYPPASGVVPGSAAQGAAGGGAAPQTIPITPQQGSRTRRRADNLVSRPKSTDVAERVVQASHTSDIRIVAPTADDDEPAGSGEPRRFRPAANAAPLDSARNVSSTDGDAAASNNRFGFASDYRWLQGSLEYSRTDRRWKLRYIPIDGQTDQYGGSVLLPDSADLASFAPGDVVRVQGQVAADHPDDTGFAPLYRYHTIDPVQGS